MKLKLHEISPEVLKLHQRSFVLQFLWRLLLTTLEKFTFDPQTLLVLSLLGRRYTGTYMAAVEKERSFKESSQLLCLGLPHGSNTVALLRKIS